MQNYHRHTSYSNLMTPDSAAVNEDYAKRAVELGHKIISSVEHGWQGYYYETFELAKKYNLKFVFGTEAYWVKDRLSDDKSNHHIIILAKNENGRQAINDILSEANITGYYYKPRIDLGLILSLPADDVVITSACIAFKGYEDIDDIILQFKNHFKDNFYLEIQYHNTDKQKDWNSHILELSIQNNIKLIVGLDSHYIYQEDAQNRDYILEAKGVSYEDEDGWFMDYPDDETVINRFLEQGIFSIDQIKDAMDNTDVCLTFDDYDDVSIFKKDIKLPTLYPNLTKDEKDKIYSKLISKKFKKYMKNISDSEWNRYFEGVKTEVQTYKDTGMVDYPLLDYAIVKDAVEHGGLITDTGRGSAVGYFTNTLCGFSKVDRFQSDIKLYPERFISTTRILETKSLPDIDLNVGTVSIFEDAQKRVLGEDHVAPMIAFGTLKKKSAFKLYAKAQGIDFDLANAVSAQITAYEKALKEAENEEDIDIHDYISDEYYDTYEASKGYWGIISDKKKAPSAYLLYQGNIRKEIGLIKCKSESTKKEYITCVIDGAVAESYKFLKNDILKVDVVLLISKVFNRIGIEHFNVNTLIEKVRDNKNVWDLYANGYTIGINQCEQKASKHKVMKYKPKNVSELSAFVAAIRPGFKSMYSKFENREDFSWGIDTLDNLIRTEELPVSFLFFQEQVMSVLNYAGFPMDECYGIIKAIAKKHPEKVKPLKQKFIDGFREKVIEDENLSYDVAQGYADQVWQIVNDNCGYGFNCVSGDTRIVKAGKNEKFNPTVEEMFKIKNDHFYAKETGHLALRKKYRKFGYGYALSMCEDGRLRPNRIVAIKESGVRQTYKVTTKSGCHISCTDNHKFPTENGMIELKNLNVGDKLYCKGEYKHKYFDASLTDGNFEKNVPKKGQQGFQNMPNGASSIYEFEKYNHIINNDVCECCGLEYSTDNRFELHHVDFDRHHNEKSNYQWLCASCHKKIHYAAGRAKRYDNGIETYLDEIISIEPDKVEMVYDIEMDDPYHTFVSESGLVTSNSAHAYCMALDSLYQAWQKVTYPYEFYEVLLQHYSDKGNKDKVAILKDEMLKGFGIKEGLYRFRRDNRKFNADKDNHCIDPSLLSLKGFSNDVAEDLYSLKDNKYNSFVELLIDLQSLRVNKTQLDILIKLNYFEEFGNIEKLLGTVDYFNKVYGKKQFKFDKLESLGIPVYIVMRNSKKITDKILKDFDSIELLNDIIDNVEFPKSNILQNIRYEYDYLGYVQSTIPNIGSEYYFVMSYTGESSRIYQLYCLEDGDVLEIKCQKKVWSKKPLEPGMMIGLDEVADEKKWGKDENGQWYRKDETERLLKDYHILK